MLDLSCLKWNWGSIDLAIGSQANKLLNCRDYMKCDRVVVFVDLNHFGPYRTLSQLCENLVLG